MTTINIEQDFDNAGWNVIVREKGKFLQGFGPYETLLEAKDTALRLVDDCKPGMSQRAKMATYRRFQKLFN